MLVIHAPGESHADWFGSRTTQLIDFSLPVGIAPGVYWPRHVDALIASIAAPSTALQDLQPVPGAADWPDILAADIRRDTRLSLGVWAELHGVRRETVSRGFLRAYGVSPAAYRLGVRVKAVIAALSEHNGGLADLAAEQGFFDQSHMNRAIRATTGHTPTQLRKVKSIQDRGDPPL